MASGVETHRGLRLASSLEYLKQQESKQHVDYTAEMQNNVKDSSLIFRTCWLTLRALAKASRGSGEALSLVHVPITF